MKNFTIATAAAAGFAAAFVGLAAPALAAPSGNGNAATTTISELEAQGNRVIVNRQSGTALSDATVVSVRQGNPIREYVWDAQGDDKIRQNVGHVLYVDVK